MHDFFIFHRFSGGTGAGLGKDRDEVAAETVEGAEAQVKGAGDHFQLLGPSERSICVNYSAAVSKSLVGDRPIQRCFSLLKAMISWIECTECRFGSDNGNRTRAVA
jgi:hypothetical protein